MTKTAYAQHAGSGPDRAHLMRDHAQPTLLDAKRIGRGKKS